MLLSQSAKDSTGLAPIAEIWDEDTLDPLIVPFHPFYEGAFSAVGASIELFQNN